MSDFAIFLRHDEHTLIVRKEAVDAFMSAAGQGTLIWLRGASPTEMHHVLDDVADVASSLGVDLEEDT